MTGCSSGAFDSEFAAQRAQRVKDKIDERLLAAILETIPPDAYIVDLGAGNGRYVRALRAAGRTATGVDGTPHIEEISGGSVMYADLTCKDAFFEWPPFGWAISIEVGEHIPANMATSFLNNLAHFSLDGIIASWAPSGQRGRGHVNPHSPEWVACEIGKRGWVIDEPAMAKARKTAGKGWDRKLLVFSRADAGTRQ